MGKIEIYNPANSPVVYSNSGHILGGDDRVEVDALDEHGQQCVANGYLVVMSDGAEDEPKNIEAKDSAPPSKPARRSSAKDKSEAGGSGASTASDDD
jgi:hypothetical protein